MPATAYTGSEIAQTIRNSAEKALHSTGFTLSEAIRLIFSKFARYKCLPFDAEAALESET